MISTGLEVYLDGYRNARGAATGGVYLRNRSADALLKTIVAQVPHLEAHGALDASPDRRRPLDAARSSSSSTWSPGPGDYVGGPMTTLAQSLPNDEWIVQAYGAVNMVYVNTSRLVLVHSGRLAADRFLTRTRRAARPVQALFDAYTMHTALHEIGHSTGRMDPAHAEGQPRDYLQEEYSWLEETRAELFGLWALRPLTEAGVFDPAVEQAGYDGMLLTMLGALKYEPLQAHVRARNAIFHYAEAQGALRRVTEDGQLRFEVVPEKMRLTVIEMLRTIADLRAAGDKPGAVRFREEYVSPIR